MTATALKRHNQRAQAVTVSCRGCHGSRYVGWDRHNDVEIECHHCTDGTMTLAEVAIYDQAQRERANDDLGGF